MRSLWVSDPCQFNYIPCPQHHNHQFHDLHPLVHLAQLLEIRHIDGLQFLPLLVHAEMRIRYPLSVKNGTMKLLDALGSVVQHPRHLYSHSL